MIKLAKNKITKIHQGKIKIPKNKNNEAIFLVLLEPILIQKS